MLNSFLNELRFIFIGKREERGMVSHVQIRT